MMHAMFDVETLGTKPNALLLSVGLVMFNPGGIHYAENFTIKYDFRNLLNLGRDVTFSVDASTLLWWSNQSKAAREAQYMANDCMSLGAASDCIQHAFTQYNPEHVWAKGASFDFPILKNAFGELFDFRKERCLRTLMSMLPKAGLPVRNEEAQPAHPSLGDALFQAEVAAHIMRRFNLYGF